MKTAIAFLAALSMLCVFKEAEARKKKAPQDTEAQQIEQVPGQPLYLPADQYTQHPSDLAPETDPHWERYEKDRQKRIEEGKPVEDPYEYSAPMIREETIR
ncbi:MAG TPA: hypothetical protein PLZ86_07920, partial [bacterium]|nr:hypothetical protein [bacterium]